MSAVRRGNGKAAADVQEGKRHPRRRRLVKEPPHQVQRIAVSLKGKGLAAHMKAQARGGKPRRLRLPKEGERRLRLRAELGVEIHQRVLVLHPHPRQNFRPRHRRRHLPDLAMIIESKAADAELGRSCQPLRRLDRVRVDHPHSQNPHAGQSLNLPRRRRIEGSPPPRQRFDDARRWIRLHGVIHVHPRHVALEEIVISLHLRQRNDHKGRGIFLR